MRRSRDELAKDLERMVELRHQNKTYRQIAQIMGYKSPGTVSDLLRKRGHFSIVFSQLEVTYLLEAIGSKSGELADSVTAKLTKVKGK